eukprot:Selendium_serpulae@DN4695_c0_g1_i2.p1
MQRSSLLFASIALATHNSVAADPHVALSQGNMLPGDAAVLFEMFKVSHSKQYDTDEEHRRRYSVFLDNYLTVATHNAKSPTERSWEAHLNHLADRAWIEFKGSDLMDDRNCSGSHTQTRPDASHRLPFKRSGHGVGPNANSNSSHPLPPWMDWRDYGVISEVKNQGSCGSCWSFAATGCLEAHIALARLPKENNELKTPLDDFSEQQLLDCSRRFGTEGCNGGLPSHAFEYIRYSGGLETEYDYPYQDGGNGSHPVHSCAFAPSKLGDEALRSAVPYGSFNITFRDEFELREVVATTGPVTIAFDVQDDFRFYKKGVYKNDTCHRDIQSVNHAVLIVGYGIDSETGIPYWLVKNSWGADWGDGGYFRIERGTNMCGLADCAAFPNIYAPTLVEDDQGSVNTGTARRGDAPLKSEHQDSRTVTDTDVYAPWDFDSSNTDHNSMREVTE